MKKILPNLFFLFLFQIGFSQENQYFPQVFFNKKAAEKQLEEGKSTIEGTAFTREKLTIPFTLGIVKAKIGKKHIARPNTVIMLFPVNEYFIEFYNLRKKYENKNTQVLMSQEAFATRREAYTDEYGRFKFDKLKTGKYYIETIINFSLIGKYKEQVGNTNYYNAYGGYLYSTPIYDTFFYNYESSNRESKFIEITHDGQIIEIKL